MLSEPITRKVLPYSDGNRTRAGSQVPEPLAVSAELPQYLRCAKPGKPAARQAGS